MSFINHQKKEINCKIVYFGPGLGGKTTNIQHIYNKTNDDSKKEVVSFGNDSDQTLFFDFLPLEFGEIGGFKTRFHLYTIPGQDFYEESRKIILRGVDGVVFVADSQIERMESNLESLKSLERILIENSYEISQLPIVMQWNKRDLTNIFTTEEMNQYYNKWNFSQVESVAINGEGVFESFKTLSKLVLMNLKGVLN